MTINGYIEQNPPLTIRENRLDQPLLLGLPYPYLSPCVSDLFQELYYWDSSFINQGPLRYGYEADAMRIARKFNQTVERCFAQTGHLWENYNMAAGSVQVTDEYKCPPCRAGHPASISHFGSFQVKTIMHNKRPLPQNSAAGVV